ncbi:MAG: serine/threonine-protein kinase [Terracidiphilus sp.]
MAFEPGEKIGDYEIVAKLGAGGLGVVYEVRHLISQRREAMKILLPDQGTPEMVERFHREVRTLATLNHVNIAALHTAFYNGNQLAMVMELVHGETLADRRLRMGISLSQVVDYTSQVLQALVYAHRLGVVHRDIKPSNIMITEGGEVKLLDFGIAFQAKSGHLTQTGYLLGSLSYMSPEQVNGSEATARSDIYSVGVMLYELLTGILPINGKTNYEILMGHMSQMPVPPHQVAEHVSIAISDTVMRALAKDPADRFQTAEEFLRALQQASSASDPDAAVTMPLPNPLAPTSRLTPNAQQSPLSSQLPKQTTTSGPLSAPLEEVTRKLALYIGPVAKFVVKKLAAQSDDMDFIYREAAKQIGSDADRAAFLRSKKQ